MCAADALPSASEPLERPKAQTAAHAQTTGQHDAVTGTNPSSSPGDASATVLAPRDPGTSGNGSRKKRDGTFEGEQQSKRHRAHSHSQTDTPANCKFAASGGERRQEGKHDGRLNCDHDGQHKTSRQHSGQHNGQHDRQQQTNAQLNGQHNGQQQTNGQLNGQHNRQQQTNGQHNTGGQGTRQAEARNSDQLDIDGRDPTRTPPFGKVRPHSTAESEATSDSALDSKLKEEEEEDEEGTDMGPPSMQLGNVDIAAAGGQALSLEMLQGLKAGLQARLSLYATETMAGDKQQLKELQEGSARYRKLTCAVSVFWVFISVRVGAQS